MFRDADAIFRTYARVWAISLGVFFAFLGFPLGYLLGVRDFWILPFMLLCGVLGGYSIRRMISGVTDGVARGVARAVLPSGDTTPYAKTYSYEQSLAVRGDVAGALEAYEVAMLDNPTDPEPRVQAAELLMRSTREADVMRAAELFREARRLAPEDDRARELYTTQRLIDCFLGPLDDPGRARVELRRLSERFPGTREAAAALIALARLKAEHPDRLA